MKHGSRLECPGELRRPVQIFLSPDWPCERNWSSSPLYAEHDLTTAESWTESSSVMSRQTQQSLSNFSPQPVRCGHDEDDASELTNSHSTTCSTQIIHIYNRLGDSRCGTDFASDCAQSVNSFRSANETSKSPTMGPPRVAKVHFEDSNGANRLDYTSRRKARRRIQEENLRRLECIYALESVTGTSPQARSPIYSGPVIATSRSVDLVPQKLALFDSWENYQRSLSENKHLQLVFSAEDPEMMLQDVKRSTEEKIHERKG
ncbi:hypothetical protein AHF37_10430 [Paragonimus kellicotti]|nr:hypothetical protein AHF37_10430 [Paragonimus kellicotti]